ncbi:MAG: ABC transporter permease, partial [Phyllobacterium sp.]
MTAVANPSPAPLDQRMSLRQRLALRGIDGVTLLVLPAVLFLLAVFIYPFLYGLLLSFEPQEGGVFANYSK